MPKARHRRTKNVDEVDLASLYRRFEDEYGDAYAALAARLRKDYPEITKPARRTGRALRNICFVVWCCCRNGDPKLIPTVVRAAVLLSAQDDYFDNPRVSANSVRDIRTTRRSSRRLEQQLRPPGRIPLHVIKRSTEETP